MPVQEKPIKLNSSSGSGSTMPNGAETRSTIPNGAETRSAEARNAEAQLSPDRPWIPELRGDLGLEQQTQTFEDLAAYLFRVAWNYLLRRQGDIDILAEFSTDGLASMAQDFVQETLEKFARNDFAILEQYRGVARFTSWAARVVTNQISAELRKVEWKRRSSMPEVGSVEQRQGTNPEQAAMCNSVAEVLDSCIQSLPQHYRRAFLGRVVEGKSSKSLGKELDITENAVDLLVFRAKPKLRKCLHISGIEGDILDIFGDVDAPGESAHILFAG